MGYDRKIVMVGGGSYNWCPRLLCDLVQTPELENSEVFLLDPNLAAAKEVKSAIDRICKDNGKKFSFTASASEEMAFKDADFVIITISTGGLEMMRHDLEVPERYGIYHTVGDSVGPGGWSRLLRNADDGCRKRQRAMVQKPGRLSNFAKAGGKARRTTSGH